MKDDELGKLKVEAANKRFEQQIAEDIERDQVKKRKADETENDNDQKDEGMNVGDPEDQAVEKEEQDEMPAKKARTDGESMEVTVGTDDKTVEGDQTMELSRLERVLVEASRRLVSGGAATAYQLEELRTVSGGSAAADRLRGALRVDISEVFSPPRVTEMAGKFGLKPGDAMDLITGWNFDREDHRQQARELIQQRRPKLLIGSPDCTMFSQLQGLSGWNEHKASRWRQARRHLQFVCELYRDQVRRGDWFLHEHPIGASSWREQCVLDVMKENGVGRPSGISACMVW